MAKPERGLPKSFTIRVPDGPVTLGDYLDDPPPQPVATAPATMAPPAPAPEPPPPPPSPAPIYVAPPVSVPVVIKPAVVSPPTPVRATPPRRQFNMSPDTLRMLDDLVNHIRAHSIERDVRASEVVHALVLAAHEIQPYMDLSKVPARGKWGSPTAAALPVALKNIVKEAIRRKS